MKLKTAYFLFLLLVFFIASNNDLYAFYAKGDTLYVLARKGLNMRAMPNPNAILLQELDYSTKVIISSDSVFDAYRVEDIKDFFITGNWRKVCTQDACGYVFDGYLSKFVAPPLKYEVPTSDDYQGVIDYYFKKFMKLKPQRTILAKHKTCKEKIYADYCIYKWKEVFNKDIFCEIVDHDSGTTEVFKFKNASFKDVYLLSKIWLLMYNEDNDSMNTCLSYDKTKNKIYFFPCKESIGCYYVLKQEANKIVLGGYCSC